MPSILQKAAKIAKMSGTGIRFHAPSLPLRAAVQVLLFLLLSFPSVRAEVAPVVTRAPKPVAWTGQRLPFFVDLRSRGTFAGTAKFDLPEIPGVLMVRAGDPVVGSQEIEGESWLVQTHEFALCAQREGNLAIPAFKVRFSRRDGYTGPAHEVETTAPALSFEIRRPPGAGKNAFIITTESLQLSEEWEPEPCASSVGTVFKRTIHQRAEQVPGMALAPAPEITPDGVRVYPGAATTQDNLYRGAFVGERRDTLTYLLQEPGAIELPALTYVWWNPKTDKLESKTLPAVVINVAAAPAPTETADVRASRHGWTWMISVGVVIGLIAWQRRRLGSWIAQTRSALNPPDRIAARGLLRACRQHDALAAQRAWTVWRSTQADSVALDPTLLRAVVDLQRHVFGPPSAGAWRGNDLADAVRQHLTRVTSKKVRPLESVLPALNPDH